MTDTHCGSFMLHLVQGSTFRWASSQTDLIHFFPLKVYVQIFWHLRQMSYLTVLRQKKDKCAWLEWRPPLPLCKHMSHSLKRLQCSRFKLEPYLKIQDDIFRLQWKFGFCNSFLFQNTQLNFYLTKPKFSHSVIFKSTHLFTFFCR